MINGRVYNVLNKKKQIGDAWNSNLNLCIYLEMEKKAYHDDLPIEPTSKFLLLL